MVITDQDLNYMNAFPLEKKAKIMQEIMSKPPLEERNLVGSNNYVRTILKLHAGGLRLIDRQPLETAFTTVWYSEKSSRLGKARSEVVALVVWEFNEDNKDITTIKFWQI